MDDPHLDLVEHCDSPNDAESEGSKQRDTACVARTDARHEGHRPDAERVTRIGQEKREGRMCAALSAVRGLCRGVPSTLEETEGAASRSTHQLSSLHTRPQTRGRRADA